MEEFGEAEISVPVHEVMSVLGTISNGEKAMVKVGQTFNGVTLLAVDHDKAGVAVEGLPFTVYNNQLKTVGDKRVTVEVFESDGPVEDQRVLMTVGDKARKSVEDGDEWFGEDKDDPNWEWDLSNMEEGVLSLVYNQRLDDLESALAVGGELELPNNFGKLTFTKLNDPEKENYDFEFETIDVEGEDVTAFVVKGKLEEGENNREIRKGAWDGESVYAYDNGEWVATTSLSYEVNNEELEFFENTFTYGHLSVDVDFENRSFTQLLYNGKDLEFHEEDVLASEGFVLVSPEDNYEDAELHLEGVQEEPTEYGVEFNSIPLPEELIRCRPLVISCACPSRSSFDLCKRSCLRSFHGIDSVISVCHDSMNYRFSRSNGHISAHY